MKNFNNDKKYFLNIATGSVDTLENWRADYDARNIEFEHSVSWKEWQVGLVEVERIDGEWVEVTE